MLYADAATAAPAFAEFLGDGPHYVLLISHVNPDGDAVGSLIGLGLALETLGHRIKLLTPTPPPPFVHNIPAIDRIQSFTDDQTLPPDIDRIILVDTGDVRRIDRVWTEQREYLLARPIAVIDHHVTNTGEGVVNYVDAKRASTCELIYELLRAWGFALTPSIATALLFGVITDTQSFRTSNTTPMTMRVAADLLEAGGDRAMIVHDVYHAMPVQTGKLLGYALLAMCNDDRIVWTHVSLDMQAATGADDDAAAEVTDYLSSLGGFQASALFKERPGGIVRVSLRSVPGVDVSAVVSQFGGGGHRQAAGCTIHGALADAETAVLQALRAALDETTIPQASH